MNIKLCDSDLMELITHSTHNRPYSFHETQVSPQSELALYQHWHKEVELLFIYKGNMVIHIEDNYFELSEGEAIIIPPRLLHYGLNASHTEIIFHAFLFDPSVLLHSNAIPDCTKYILPLLRNGNKYICHLTPEVKWQYEILQCLVQILNYRSDISSIDSWELNLIGILYQLWNHYYINFLLLIEYNSRYQQLYHRLSPALFCIEHDYASNLTLNDLANQVNLAPATFCRYFKEFTGDTPIQYLNRYRIKLSCLGLSDLERKITDIACDYGFNNISYYNRAFLHYIRCTPSEFRKRQIKNENTGVYIH